MCALYIVLLATTYYIRHLLLDPTSLAVDLDLWYGTAPMATCYVLSCSPPPPPYHAMQVYYILYRVQTIHDTCENHSGGY